MHKRTTEVYAVILVGGKGRRLRPLSTDSRPKAFLSVTRDRKTLFKNTVDRIAKILPRKNIVVVANRIHAALIRKDLPALVSKNLLLEPVARNTAASITYAALVLQRRRGDAVMVVLPADHYIPDAGKFLACVKRAIWFVEGNPDALVTIGIKPTHPSAEFGYIKLKADSRKLIADTVYKVERFIEKPNVPTAKKYLKEGRYLWNSGVFVFTAEALLKAVESFAPNIPRTLRDGENMGKRYHSLPDISIDYAVMENADNIYCAIGDFAWFDIGNFENLKVVLERESREFISKGGAITKIL